MLNKRSLIVISLVVALGVVGFSYIQHNTNVDVGVFKTVTVNAMQDTEDLLNDIETNPEILKDKDYLTTRLELVLRSQEDFLDLKYVNWGEYKAIKGHVKSLLLYQELALKGYLEDREDDGDMNLEILKDYYNMIMERRIQCPTKDITINN